MTENIEFENNNAPKLFRIDWCGFNVIAIIGSCFNTNQYVVLLDKLLYDNFHSWVDFNQQQPQGSGETKLTWKLGL